MTTDCVSRPVHSNALFFVCMFPCAKTRLNAALIGRVTHLSNGKQRAAFWVLWIRNGQTPISDVWCIYIYSPSVSRWTRSMTSC